MKKIFSFLSVMFLAILFVSCAETAKTSNFTTKNNSSTATAVVSSSLSKSTTTNSLPETLKVTNVKQYLDYDPAIIDTYYDSVLQRGLDLYYEIMDEDICEIKDGKVYGKKIGETQVFASDINGLSDDFVVYIKNPNEYIFDRDVTSVIEDFKIREVPKGSTLFLGDSFFDYHNFWRGFYDDFESKNCFSAGLSSTKTTDWMMFVEKVIYPYEPKNLVVHIGTNDINDGKSALTPAGFYEQITILLEKICKDLPNTKIIYFGIENRTQTSGYSARNPYQEIVTKRIMEEFAPQFDNFTYIDSPAIFNPNQSTYVSADGIHPSLAGYEYYVSVLNEILVY